MVDKKQLYWHVLIRSASWLSQAPNWGWQTSRLSWTGSPTNLTWTQPLMPPRHLLKTMNPEQETGFIYCPTPPHTLLSPPPCHLSSLPLPRPFLTLVQRGIYSGLFLVRPVTWSCMLGKLRCSFCLHTHAHMYSGWFCKTQRQTEWELM